MQKQQIIEQMQALRRYALGVHPRCWLTLHREDSHLVRFANSGVSLNTRETLVRVNAQLFEENRSASATVLCDPADLVSMQQAVDRAKELLAFASPLSYTPTFVELSETSVDEQGYDPALADTSNEDILSYVNQAVQGLETEDISLSGSFSVGSTQTLSLSTASEHYVYWRASDAQVTLVLASLKDKWEINAEQSATRLTDLDAAALHSRLTFLWERYRQSPAVQLPLDDYTVVFGEAATAEYLSYLCFLGVDGGSMMRGQSIHQETDIGRQVLSEKLTLYEDPGCLDAFSIPTDMYGRKRQAKAWIDKGVLTGFIWTQDNADEYAQEATGHSLEHASFRMAAGDTPVNDLEALAALPRDRDILYVPYLHYTGLVNPSEGLVTGSSRFGALLFKQDGSIQVPYNVRFTQRLSELLGPKLRWLSTETVPYNSSSTYDARDPVAYVVPRMMCCEGIRVEISNSSY